MNVDRRRLIVLLLTAFAWTTRAPAAEPLGPRSPTDVGAGDLSASREATAAPGPAAEGVGPKYRRREGTKLAEQTGKFERRGDRYVFLTADSPAHLEVLENLMLERVAAILDETSGGSLQWSVSGALTEYRGANYLLLSRAVVKSSTAGGEPRRLDDAKPGSTTLLPVQRR